ncbi:Lactosylceramide 4-alpha-galactosyltransferase [Chionoecetes opilio]|nr:Lactosylceramide 4-alpha-galactosyltransferase [Chionoecetes opilio]
MVKECGMKLLELIQKAPVTCSGNITLFPTSTFFPVRYNLFQYYFKPGGGKHFNVTFGRSVALHFWNKMSKNKTVKVNSNSVYEVAAKRFCPITYRTATTHSNVF